MNRLAKHLMLVTAGIVISSPLYAADPRYAPASKRGVYYNDARAPRAPSEYAPRAGNDRIVYNGLSRTYSSAGGAHSPLSGNETSYVMGSNRGKPVNQPPNLSGSAREQRRYGSAYYN